MFCVLCYNASMGMFWSSGSTITKEEFKRALWHLMQDHGFSHEQLRHIEEIFRGDISEEGSSAGISDHELKRAVQWMHEHPGRHPFSHEQKATIEKVLRRYL